MMNEEKLLKHMPTPTIGLLPTGHEIYWNQFPYLKQNGLDMLRKYTERLSEIGELIIPEIIPIDTPEKARQAGQLFKNKEIDIIIIFPLSYTTGMVIVPTIELLPESIPIRILNSHEDDTYDYKNADTTMFLHHEGICCIPEYSGTLKHLGRSFLVRSGEVVSDTLWDVLTSDIQGAAAASAFKACNIGLIGSTYTNMTDMPIDEHRVLKTFGRLLRKPEVEEVAVAYEAVSAHELEDMYEEIRTLYDVDQTVTNEHLKESAKLCVAYEKVIKNHGINAFGFFWWGENNKYTSLRSESAIAVSRLASFGIPGVTEGDVKTAMGMKILDLLGAGGMFLEFFSFDYKDNFIMMGHDGPSNINLAVGKPRLQHLAVHHGKTGEGLGIDFDMKTGKVTIINITQFYSGQRFKIIFFVGELVGGDILNIGNPNCRIKIDKPLSDFMNAWCQEGPCHHMALGYGDKEKELRTFAEAIGFDIVKV